MGNFFMCLLADGSKSHIFSLNIFSWNIVLTLINLFGIIKFENSKKAVVNGVLNRLFQCKYFEALKDIMNLINKMTLCILFSKCNQTNYQIIITMTTENTLRTKSIIVSYFIGPLDTDLRYAPSLFNIAYGTPAPEII